MYLIDKEIKEIIHNGVFENAEVSCVDSVSCDLHIKYIVGDENAELAVKELEPGETAIVAANERINMPDDMIGTIIHKNSRLRTGLSVSAPVYRPGHKTRIFLSVSNLSGSKIEIAAGESIAAIMFDRLEQKPDTVYTGGFQDENAYKGLGNYESVWGTRIKKIDDKYLSIKDLEKSIYGNVLVIMTIFLGLFSLLNFELSVVKSIANDIFNIVRYNIIYLGSISLLICLANLILPYGGKRKWLLLIIPFVCILISLVMAQM